MFYFLDPKISWLERTVVTRKYIFLRKKEHNKKSIESHIFDIAIKHRMSL